MTFISIALVGMALGGAPESPSTPGLDVPAAQAPEPHIVWPTELQARRDATETRQRGTTEVAAGLGSAALGYGLAVLAAAASDVGNSIGCAIGDAFTPRGTRLPPCPPAASKVLYVPFVGPPAYLLNGSRPKDAALDLTAAAAGLMQLAGAIAIVHGAVVWRSADSTASGSTATALRLLPVAPAATAGATLQLRI